MLHMLALLPWPLNTSITYALEVLPSQAATLTTTMFFSPLLTSKVFVKDEAESALL